MRILKPQEFVNRVLLHAPKVQTHIIKWQSHYPQFIDDLWRNDVLDIFARDHKNKFSKVKFIEPDHLDDEWMFLATPIPEAWPEPAHKEDHKLAPMVGQPLGVLDYLIIFFATICIIIGGTILYFTGELP